MQFHLLNNYASTAVAWLHFQYKKETVEFPGLFKKIHASPRKSKRQTERERGWKTPSNLQRAGNRARARMENSLNYLNSLNFLNPSPPQLASILTLHLKNIMEKDQKFPQQDAPVKNTDKAFVKVAHDGSSQIPEVKETREEKKDQETGDKNKKP